MTTHREPKPRTSGYARDAGARGRGEHREPRIAAPEQSQPHPDTAETQPEKPSHVDPHVDAKPTRRVFTTAYKLDILAELDGVTQIGDVGRILRREALYSSHITTWRKQRDTGELNRANPKRRGRKPDPERHVRLENEKLQRRNARLEEELRKAHLIIAAQKKLAQILNHSSIDEDEDDESDQDQESTTR